MRILIVNSDSARNRGDRAILAGNIALVKDTWPEAEIWSFSENVCRDEAWFGIRFLPIGIFTLNPFDFLRMAAFARKCDMVLWGGGEILKDYTNRSALFYWLVKIAFIRAGNRNIYGVFQGIGATKSRLGRALIVRMVNWTKIFLVRDDESRERLESWGTRATIVASYDPAVLLRPERIGVVECASVLKKVGLAIDPARPCIGVGVRRWFHYRQHGWIPFRWRQRFCLGARHEPQVSPMEKHLAGICDWLADELHAQIVFFPMHLAEAEADVDVALRIMRLMSHGESAMCVSEDALSPQEYLDLMGCCRFFVGVRLHSCILATAAGVPALLFYYAEKGRRYFDQLGMADMAIPIRVLLEEDAVHTASGKMNKLVLQEAERKAALSERIGTMRNALCADFRQWIGGYSRA